MPNSLLQKVVDKSLRWMYNKIVQQKIIVYGGLKMANKLFGERVKKLRLDNKMTMDELAQKLNITKSRISMWENNGTVPREDVLIQLSKLYGVSIDYLLGNEEQEGTQPVNMKLSYIQRNLGKLDNDRLQKAETVLKAVFEDIFDEEEDHGDL